MNLLAAAERAEVLARSSAHWPSFTLDPRQLADLELLLNGSFAPLDGFMTRDAAERCAERMQLPDGTFWPEPIVLDVPAAAAAAVGTTLVLRDPEGAALAVLHVSDAWNVDTGSGAPAMRLGGRLEGLSLPRHYDFKDLRLLPSDVRDRAAQLGWSSMIAYPSDELVHRSEFVATLRIMDELRAGLLIQAPTAPTAPADERHYSRIRAYRAAANEYPGGRVQLTLSPLATPADARSAALAAIVAKNHGCSHVLLDAARCRELTASGIGMNQLAIVPVPLERSRALSRQELEARLADGSALPAGFTFPSVEAELRRTYPPRHLRGLTVWFTGLSGSGKSTIANAVRVKLLERGDRRVTLLDGDLVRRHLSSELGFSREHRNLNVRRIGFVASEISRHGGIAICAPISPYDSVRREVRAAIEAVGAFVLVFVDTPLEVCETRDPKGLYARARAGLIPEFTGVSDPYEPPGDAELVIDTTTLDAGAAVERVLAYLEDAGYLDRQKIV